MQVCVGAGVVFWAFDLARELEKHGHLQKIYTSHPPRYLPSAGIPRHRIDTASLIGLPHAAARRLGLHRLRRTLEPLTAQAFDLWTAANLHECHVYHCVSGFGLRTHDVAAAGLGAVTVCDRGSTHILTQRRVLHEEAERLHVNPYAISDRIVIRELAEYERCDAIFVPSTFARQSFLEHGVPPSKVYQIPYGVDTQSFRPLPKEDNVFRVLFVGSIGYRKGVSYLLRALNHAPRDRFDTWLIGARTPETTDLLRPYRGTFRYLGVRPRDELAWYFSQCSVLVLPSLEEGLALVQAQAMACGLPVVATPNTGALDLFTDGVEGIIVPPRDPPAIRAAIDRLYEDPDQRAGMGLRARQRVQALGGWDHYIGRIRAAYGQLLDDAGPP